MSLPRFASRLNDVGTSPAQAMMGRVRELRRQGVRVINFGSKGDTPHRAKDAAIALFADPDAAYYTDSRGTPELRQAIARKLKNQNGIAADPDRHVVVTLGGMQALFLAVMAFVDTGDEVLVDDPGWMNFAPMIQIAGGVPVPVPLDVSQGFRFDLEAMRARITRRSRAIILCNPDNPTGRVLDRTELEGIAELARVHDLVVIADEAYEDFLFDGRQHLSIATLDGMADRTVTVHTMSKLYNMFGWRVGWLCADAAIVDRIMAVHSRMVASPPSFTQAGAAAVLGGGIVQGELTVAEAVARYQAQRDAMVAGLNAIAGVRCWSPQGAYFAFPDLGSFGLGSVEMANYLLEEARVATTPGVAFGALGEGHLRMLLNAPVAEIEEGLEQMARALDKLR